MSTITAKNFKETYGLSLLPYSTENTLIGQLMYKEGMFTKVLKYCNETILDILEISSSQKEEIQKQLQSIPINNALFPDIIIEHSFNENNGLKVPIINLNLSGILKTNKDTNFTLTNVKSRDLTGNLEHTLKSFVQKSKKAEKDIRDKLIITRLFYADSVVLKTSNGLDADLDSSLSKAKLKDVSVQSKNNDDGSSSYTFTGTGKCPFAAQLEKFSQM